MTSNEEIETIRKRAQEFSKALTPIVMRKNIIILGGCGETCFPKGGCAKSSRMFGHFLLKEKIVTNLVRCKHRDSAEYEHTWLEYRNWIIDLTCCQFDGLPKRTKCPHHCPDPMCCHTEELPPLPKFPHECPFVSESELDWHSTCWPRELRECQDISETYWGDDDSELIGKIEAAILSGDFDD